MAASGVDTCSHIHIPLLGTENTFTVYEYETNQGIEVLY